MAQPFWSRRTSGASASPYDIAAHVLESDPHPQYLLNMNSWYAVPVGETSPLVLSADNGYHQSIFLTDRTAVTTIGIQYPSTLPKAIDFIILIEDNGTHPFAIDIYTYTLNGRAYLRFIRNEAGNVGYLGMELINTATVSVV